MQNTGRSPLHLLLDDRASRDGACGSDRRRRARGPARQSRTLRRQEDQGRLGKEGRHRVQEAHRRHHARTEHDERVHAQTVQTARDAGRRGQAREPTGPRVRRLRPARASGGRSYLCPRQRGGWAYVCLLVGLADRGIAGHSAGRARDTGLVLAAFATLDFPLTDVQVFHTEPGSAAAHVRLNQLTDVQVFHTEPGQRIRQHEVRRAARRVRHQKIAAAQGQPLRQRRGRIDEQAAEEGARVPEPLHHDRAAEA